MFWLKAKRSLLNESTFGTTLQREFGVNPDRAFFHHLRDVSSDLDPVDPECFVVSFTKKDALEKFEALLAQRGESTWPIMPFMFQTANGKDFKRSLFFVFKAAEDAFRVIITIACQRQYCMQGRPIQVFFLF